MADNKNLSGEAGLLVFVLVFGVSVVVLGGYPYYSRYGFSGSFDQLRKEVMNVGKSRLSRPGTKQAVLKTEVPPPPSANESAARAQLKREPAEKATKQVQGVPYKPAKLDNTTEEDRRELNMLLGNVN